MKRTTRFLAGLLGLDVVFALLQVCLFAGYLTNENFGMNVDGGYAEIFQYCKFVSASGMLAYLAWRARSAIFAFWSSLVLFLFLDDWLRLHERVGGKVLGPVVMPSRDGAYPLGQVIYGVVAACGSCAVAVHLWRAATSAAKALSLRLFAALGVLWLSAVAVDYVHAVFMVGEYHLAGVLVEEGGEHVGASLLLWTCVTGVAAERAGSRGSDRER